VKRFSETTVITSLLCILFILHLSAFAVRSEKLTELGGAAFPSKLAGPSLQRRSFTGTVANVDIVTKTLVAREKTSAEEIVFDLTFAKFLRGGKIEDMKVGDKVGLRYVVSDSSRFVTSIVDIPAGFDKVHDGIKTD